MIYTLSVVNRYATLTITHNSVDCVIFLQYVEDQFNYQDCRLYKTPFHVLPEGLCVPKSLCYKLNGSGDVEIS